MEAEGLMDPDAALLRLLEAVCAESFTQAEREKATEAFFALLDWREIGGFAPRDPRREAR